MDFSRNFRTNIVVRIGLILGLGYAGMYIIMQTHFWLVSGWIGLAVILMVSELIRYVERSDRELAHFLLSISQNDFSNTYPPNRKGRGDRLHEAFRQLMQVFGRLRDEKEINHQYLQTVVEHISIALLCVNEKGEVKLMNAAAKVLFRKPFLRHIQSLSHLDPHLPGRLLSMTSGERVLLKLEIDHTLVSLSIQATRFKLHGEIYSLLSFQDIRHELEAQEVESWQKLIRVLTHEIMNSVIPISTLTTVVNDMLVDDQGQRIDLARLNEEDTADLHGSLKTIESRSKGLVNFVKAYKSITQIATPKLKDVSIQDLLERVHWLLKPQTDKRGIAFTLGLPEPTLRIKADAEMIEQVLINLIMNAVDAVSQKELPHIELIAGATALGQVILKVSDNGAGMNREVQEQIFVPFYTTKPHGSGVGLSLSKQIMLLHQGRIKVQSEPGIGSSFTLEF